MSQTTPPQAPVFNPNAPHHARPKLRAIRGFPAQGPNNQQMIGLTDARQISDKVVYASPAVQMLLPLMDGKHTIDEIIGQVGRGLNRPILEGLVAQLDEAGLMEGPTFDAILAKMRADFDGAPNLPPASSAAMAEALIQQGVQQGGEAPPANAAEAATRGAEKIRKIFDEWTEAALKNSEKKSFDGLPKGVIAPHLDYPRGWLNYASTWGRMRGVARPERIVILGTNHFGMSTGVCGCDKGYETPLGICEADHDLIATVRRRLGEADASKLFEHRYDHEREHSIELQIPWIQHVFGPDASGKYPKVFGVLVHDPSVNAGESYDGKGLSLEGFLKAMESAIAEMPGPTLIVSSADLSHVGPAFGDQQTLAGEAKEAVEFRNKVVSHDREMLGMFGEGKAEDMMASMSWQQNPTRWCSIGNMVAAMRLAKPSRVELLNYAAAMDPQGYTFVSSASLVLA